MSDNIVLIQETIQAVQVYEGAPVSPQFASAAEVNAGVVGTKIISPSALAGSNYRTRAIEIWAIEATATCAIGNGKNYFRVPSTLNSYSLSKVAATCITAGTTGTMTVQLRNVTQSNVDMLSTRVTIDSGETDSLTAATPAVINSLYKVVAEGDIIAVDLDTVHTTPAEGLLITMEFVP